MKSLGIKYSFFVQTVIPIREYFKIYIWPIEDDRDFNTYYGAVVDHPYGPFTNKIVLEPKQQTIDLEENEVAEVLSPEELERLYIKTIELDDIGQDETTQGEE